MAIVLLSLCYNLGSDGSIPRSLEAMPISSTNLVKVEYKRLMSATSNFNQLSYKEGGNKLGEGGFGEVFHCRLSLGGRSLEIAVKVLSNKVSSYECLV